VPFAIDAGKPRKMSVGSVIREPPPATVFMNPATAPTEKTTGICQISIELQTYAFSVKHYTLR